MMTKEERQWVQALEDKVGALDIRMMELERSNRSLWQVYNEHDDRLDDIERIVRKLAKAEIKRRKHSKPFIINPKTATDDGISEELRAELRERFRAFKAMKKIIEEDSDDVLRTKPEPRSFFWWRNANSR